MVLGLLLSGNVVNAKEIFYLRCIPEVKVVRAGDSLKEGDILEHRLVYFVFENEIDLTVSEKPVKILKKSKIYTTFEGKKNKLKGFGVTYTTSDKTISVNFEDSYSGTSMQYFSQINVNHDGGSWVASGTTSFAKVVDNKVEKDNFSWFGKCIEIDKKQFKKPELNQAFYDKHK